MLRHQRHEGFHVVICKHILFFIQH